MPNGSLTQPAELAQHSAGGKLLSAERLAPVGLLLVLFLMAAISLSVEQHVRSVTSQTTVDIQLSERFEEARNAVILEESLERKYRLEPSTSVRKKFQETAATFGQVTREIASLGQQADRAMSIDLLARQDAYLLAIRRMFAAVDAGDSTQVLKIDEQEVDPLFEVIESRVFTAADAHRLAAHEGIAKMRRTHDGGLIAVIAGIVLSCALVALLWKVLRSYAHKVRTQSLQQLEASKLNERRTRALIENSNDVFIICDQDSRVRFASHALHAHWGYQPGALIGEPLASLIYPDDGPKLEQAWRALVHQNSSSQSLEIRARRADGTVRVSQMALQDLSLDPAIGGLVVTLHDFTERRALEHELTHQAFHDALTGLPNRSLFQDRVERSLARTKRNGRYIGLLFVDLDNFKAVNDGMGHAAGDQLLIQVAERLTSCVRPGDTIARLGGDEFTVLLEDLDESAVAVNIADRILHSLAEPMTIFDRLVYVGCSIGVVAQRAQGQTHDDLLREADLALHKAKLEGRGRFALFEPELRAAAVEHLALERDLRSAIRLGHMSVVYQPIVSLADGSVVEVEALMRWNNPERGAISPATFIPLAEKSGYIVELGLWGLEQACLSINALNENTDGRVLVLSVNLSPRQFQSPTLLQDIDRILAVTGFDPAHLKLEITEGVVVKEFQHSVATLSALRQRGIKIAMDDFGTGYSSLSYLKKLPLDVLKIDRSFVRGVSENAQDAALVETILSLARTLGLSATAEGIETEAQASKLRSLNCQQGQGFLFFRPMSLDQLHDAIRLSDGSHVAGTQSVFTRDT